MPTITDFVSGVYKNPNAVRKDKIGFEIWRAKLDFGYGSRSAADVIQMINVPDTTWVYNVWLNVTTAATTNAKVDVGYGSDTDYWGAAIPIDSTGVITGRKVEDGAIRERSLLNNVPLYFSSADTIDVIPTKNDGGAATVSAGVVEVCALVMKTIW